MEDKDIYVPCIAFDTDYARLGTIASAYMISIHEHNRLSHKRV